MTEITSSYSKSCGLSDVIELFILICILSELLKK